MPARARQLLTRHGWLVAIACVYLYVFPYFPRIQSANELPRVYLVKAIVHDGTFAIDRGVRQWGGTADVSPHAGHLYSNKAPGSSLLVVPIYAGVTLVAGEPSLAATLWLCRVIAGVIPAVLFLLLLWGFLARFAPEPEVRRVVVIAYALGSMAMTYALLYYSHQLAAICIASAWILCVDVVERKRGTLAMLAAGALAGAAPLVDYQAAFAGVPIAIYLVVQLIRTRTPREIATLLGIAAAGAAIPIAILLWYHAQCFGGPLRTGYDASTTFAHFHQQGFLGITEPRREAFWGSLFAADNGLLVLSPWLLLAIPGGVVLWRRGQRAAVLVGAAVSAIFIAFVSSITFWRGGWGVGPRYVTAMLPFTLPFVAALLSAAYAWRTSGITSSEPTTGASRESTAGASPSTSSHFIGDALAGLLCAGVVSAVTIYTLSSLTFPYWPDSLKNPLYEVTLRLLADGAVAPNVLGALGASGYVAAAPYLIAIATLLGWTIARYAGWRGLVVAALGGVAIIAAFALVRGTGPHAERAYKNTVYPAVTR